jgi:hypothetical protein
MASINCAACSGQVSTGAAACPHCGAPIHRDTASAMRGDEKASIGGKIALCLVVVVIVGVIALIVGPSKWSAIPVQTVAGQLPGSN